MSFCPSCRAEFVDSVRVCTDCGERLVNVLPPESTDHNLRLVDVYVAQGEVDAQLVRSLLEANNIDCMLSGESVRLTFGFTIDGLAEVRIRVREGDAARARDVLAASEALCDCPSCGETVPAGAIRCRRCGAPIERDAS